MRYITLFISFLIIGATVDSARAQDVRYRVEVIVLTHLDHGETPREAATPRDYGDAIDFLAPPPETTGESGETVEPVEEPLPEPAAPGGQEASEAEIPEPPRVVHIEELGPEMQDAWRRLRLSGPFRPLVALAWEQAGDEPFPRLRVHDEEVVLSRDPFSAVRERLEAGEAVDPWLLSGLPPLLPPADGSTVTDDVTLERLPPPNLFYALDGTVSLIRSRFLHLHADLQWREPVFAAPAAEPLTLPRGLRAMPSATPAADAEPVPTSFRVFELDQDRQVRTGQVEYFDGPVLSLLARVTTLEAPAASD